jgi:hypothetical protein
MSHALDLNHTKSSRQFGDITAMFTWIGKDKTPCVALVPTNLIGKRPIRPCVIPMTSSWAWAEETGDGAHCARQSMIFAECLGLNPANVNDVMRVTSIIRECLGDLLAMPPKPTERVVVADAIRVDHDSGKEHHSEIVENV